MIFVCLIGMLFLMKGLPLTNLTVDCSGGNGRFDCHYMQVPEISYYDRNNVCDIRSSEEKLR